MVIFQKMYLPLLLVVGLAYAVNARDCLSPTVMESLDLSKVRTNSIFTP